MPIIVGPISKLVLSTPSDGMAEGRGITEKWDDMLYNYYTLMGWDEKTGKPRPEMLRSLGLAYVIPHLGE